MTRVLVSGGTGYVGRFIVEDLLAHGYKVTVGGRNPPAPDLFSRPVAFMPLTLDPSIDQIDAFSDAYYFVHAALDHVEGKYRGGEGDDLAGFYEQNLEGTVRLFEAARDAGVRRCVFLSSRAVYGPQPNASRLVETLHCRPDTAYGKIKLQGERSLQALCGHSFVTASLRATGIYGAARRGHGHKWHSLFQAYANGNTIAPRAGTEVHGLDVAAAVRLMLSSDPVRINGETFNLSDVLTDHREILSIVQSVTGCDHALPNAADRAAMADVDTCKISVLGWKPGGHDLLERTVRTLALE